MPRTIPWLKDSKSSASSKTTRTSADSHRAPLQRPAKRQKRDSSSPPSNQSPEPSVSASRSRAAGQSRAGRTPSTSPPPIPAPSESPMHAGDDAWIMVEDEFYATAGAFTSHLHQAEYKRLKQEAWKKSDEAIEEIERPTDGRTRLSEPARLKYVQEAKRKALGRTLVGNGKLERRRQDDDHEYLSDHDDEDEDGNGLEMKDKALAGLMMGTGTGRRPIKRRLAEAMRSINPNTRAAAGFGKQKVVEKPRPTGSLLDGLASATSARKESALPGSVRDAHKTVITKTEDQTEPSLLNPSATADGSNRHKTRQPSRLPSEPETGTSFTRIFSQRAIKVENTENDVTPPVLAKASGAFSYDELPPKLRDTKKSSSAAAAAERDAKSKGVELEDIPTFLF